MFRTFFSIDEDRQCFITNVRRHLLHVQWEPTVFFHIVGWHEKTWFLSKKKHYHLFSSSFLLPPPSSSFLSSPFIPLFLHPAISYIQSLLFSHRISYSVFWSDYNFSKKKQCIAYLSQTIQKFLLQFSWTPTSIHQHNTSIILKFHKRKFFKKNTFFF